MRAGFGLIPYLAFAHVFSMDSFTVLIPTLLRETIGGHQGISPYITSLLDQGSVLVVRAFGSLSTYFALQPEVVPTI